MSRRRSFFFAKCFFTALTIGYVLFIADLREALFVTAGAHLGWVLLALAVNGTLLAISTLKWEALLRQVDIRAGFGRLLRFYTIGFFGNLFLPGTVGGDVIRWHIVGSENENRLLVATSILVERMAGVVALIALSVLAVTVQLKSYGTWPVVVGLTSVTVGAVCALIMARSRYLAIVPAYRLRRHAFGKAFHLAHRLHGSLCRYDLCSLGVAFVYSAAFYLTSGVVFFVLAVAFHVPLSLVDAVTVQLLVAVLTLAPVSLGGLGLAQVGDVYLLGLLGIQPSDALVLSLGRQLINYLYGLVGALLFLGWRNSSQ